MDIFRTLIVPTANVELARAIAASFGSGGAGMWTTPLSPTGAEPATHYISTGYIPAEFAYLVPCQTWGHDMDGNWIPGPTDPGDPVAVYNLAVEAGIICTQDDIDDLFAAADVTEQEPFVAMGRLGVGIVNPPMEGV
ncbi:MAG: hypothetical protein ABFD60_15260 [Bryobacteraceae bacterium]